jgi:hypothetical protein
LSAATNRVQGILVRGGTDYKRVDDCNVAFPCPLKTNPGDADCKGEDATLISEIAGTLKGVAATKELSLAPPILKLFRSGPVPSGTGSGFSREYTVISDPAPPGYKIAGFTYSLVGDRGCNAWSTCKASVEGDRVVFRFSLQGHSEWFPPRPGISEGVLNVKYVSQ